MTLDMTLSKLLNTTYGFSERRYGSCCSLADGCRLDAVITLSLEELLSPSALSKSRTTLNLNIWQSAQEA